MIVFWKEHFNERHWHAVTYAWRGYTGRAKLRNGFCDIYPTNGRRQRLSSFIAFDDETSVPPRLLKSTMDGTRWTGPTQTGGVEQLPRVGAIARLLPATYVDLFGNIRRLAPGLPLVLAGPDWSDEREAALQDEINLPF